MMFSNVVDRFSFQANHHPDAIAIEHRRHPLFSNKYSHITFKEVWSLSQDYLALLEQTTLKKGDRVLVFLKPQLEFTSIILSLFQKGLVPVFIDPGMGKENLLNSIKQIKPKALLGEPIIYLLKSLYPHAFCGIKYNFINSSLTFGNLRSIKKISTKSLKDSTYSITPSDTAAILFTSGGTGIPKGVRYTHEMFNYQTELLQEMFHLTPEDIDLPGFPLFGMFTQAMGIKNIIPNLNPSKPSKLNPKRVIENLTEKKVTFAAGSPAIWINVVNYCLKNKISLPHLKKLVMFGAPVGIELHEKLKKILPNGETYTPYGATECLPISLISGTEVLENFRKKIESGHGTCVGKVVRGQSVKIIPIYDHSLNEVPPELPAGEVGEILVTGPTVSPEYVEMEDKTSLAKIIQQNTVWHRMGDLGYLDTQKNLWFCGRKAHSFVIENQRFLSTPIENIYNSHPKVENSALIYMKKPSAAVVFLLKEKISKKELLRFSAQFTMIQDLTTFYVAKEFPVDVRHNIKIDRAQLSNWATQGKLKCIY